MSQKNKYLHKKTLRFYDNDEGKYIMSKLKNDKNVNQVIFDDIYLSEKLKDLFDIKTTSELFITIEILHKILNSNSSINIEKNVDEKESNQDNNVDDEKQRKVNNLKKDLNNW